MQSESRYKISTNSKGVSYTQHNSDLPKGLKSHLSNQIDKLVTDHNVTVSNTMIKVTYNKGMRDHSVIAASKNEFDHKRRAITYCPSYSESYNTKLSVGSKNQNKSYNKIVFIPNNVAVARSNGVTLVKNKIQKEYQGLSEGKIYITPHNNSFKEDIEEIKSNDYNFTFNKDLHLKQLTLHLKKMNTSIAQGPSKSPGLVHHVVQNYPHVQNNITNEINDKKFLKYDSPKHLNENKDPSCSANEKKIAKKVKVKLNDSSCMVKERLKHVKSKDDDFKKKRPASAIESQGKTKKLKNDSDILIKEAKEKGNISKSKEKKVSINHKEKKMPVKTFNSSQVIKRELLRDDPTLPPGWRRIVKGRHIGEEFKPVICIASPEGRKFYFKAKLQEYLKKTNSHLNINDFHFGLYEKGSKDRSNKEQNKKVNSEEKNIVKKPKKKKLELEFGRNGTKKIRLDKTNNNKDNAVKIYSPIKHQIDKGGGETDTGEKNILLVDPDLPSGWVRKVRIKNGVEGPDKFQVCVISPEGKKFRRKYLLQKHLLKTGSPLNINQFYFGLYPKKDGSKFSPPSNPSKYSTSKLKNQINSEDLPLLTVNENEKFIVVEGKKYSLTEVESSHDDSQSYIFGGKQKSLIITNLFDGVNNEGEQLLLEDSTLPSGWHRFIKVRAIGETAGKMEVVIVSPDGREHRSKESLKNYITENGLNLNADEFDFTLFGKTSRKENSCLMTVSPTKGKPEGQIIRKRDSLLLPSDTSFPNLNLDHASVFDSTKHSREALMIHYVGGIMLNCGLRDLRFERRHRISREEQEKILKRYLESDVETANDEDEISTNWVQKLIHCRSDFGTLEGDAASTIASLTKEFLQEFTRHALEVSKSENSLEYRDLAEVVDKSECLSPLKTLIPKKITFKKFIRLNRPTKFSSFT